MESNEMKRKDKGKADDLADGMDVQTNAPSSTGSSPPPKKFKSEGRIIVVSYRLPLEITLEEGAEHRTRPDGMEIALDEDPSMDAAASSSSSSSSSSASTSSMSYGHHHGVILPRRSTVRGQRNGKGTVVKRSRSPINHTKQQHQPDHLESLRALEDFTGLAYNAHNLRFDHRPAGGDSGASSSGTLPANNSTSSIERENEERELKELNSGGAAKKKRWRLERQTKLVMKVTQLLENGLAAFPQSSVLWVGTPEVYVDDPQDREELTRRCIDEHGCIPVWIKDDVIAAHNNFSNGMVWSLFHYQKPSLDYDEKNYAAYKRVNQLYAQTLLKSITLQPNDLIWVHEYHTILVPTYVQAKIPRARIGFYLHIPFPSSEIYRIIPSPAREDLLNGFLACRLVGFQTLEYITHFLKACTRVMGLETSSSRVFVDDKRTTALDVFPACIDPSKLQGVLKTPAVRERIRQLEEKFAGKKMLLGVDRLDYVKGIPQKLQGLMYFFNKYPEWRGKVVLVQVALPARIKLRRHKKLKKEVDELVGRINHQYASADYSPIHYMTHSVEDTDICALYSIATAQLITSLRGGMPSTALEYIICQQERHGMLILSEFTGAASSLGSGALLINPWDAKDVATAIHKAITMPAEVRRMKSESLYNFVMGNSAARWAERFISALKMGREESKAENKEKMEKRSPAGLTMRVLQSYHARKKRLLLFSYDGTLMPFFPLPDMGHPDQRLLRTLAKLISDPRNVVVIISGRKRQTMEEWFKSLPGLGLGAEHGFFYRPPHSTEWRPLAEFNINLSWMDAIKPIFEHFTERTPGSLMEVKEYHLVWHFSTLLSDNEYGRAQARELQLHLEGSFGKWPIRIDADNMRVEVGPNGINSTHLIRNILRNEKESKWDFVLYLGDNTLALSGLFNYNVDKRLCPESGGESESEEEGLLGAGHQTEVVIASVGKKNKQAAFHLRDATEVLDFLESLTSGYFVF